MSWRNRVRSVAAPVLLLALPVVASAGDRPGQEPGISVDAASLVPAWSFEPNNLGDNFGSAASTAGDVNGDGYSDVIVGAPNADDGQAHYPGRAYVFLGGTNGLAAAPVWTAQLGATGAEFGAAVAVAGDVNGDGYDDVIVGSPSGIRPGGGCFQPGGAAYVFHGGPGGPSLTYNWAAGLCDGMYARFGGSVAPAGDVNGDGYDDVIIGASDKNGGYDFEGYAYIYMGSPTGLAANPAWTVHGGSLAAHLGVSVATAGDVNADGYADVIVGAHIGADGMGEARIYLGGPTGPSLFPSLTLHGDQSGASYGAVVGTAGDIDGDGYSDVFVSAPWYDYVGNDRGAMWVYPGGPSGVSATPLWYEYGFDANARFGLAAATAGDVNGDGLSELVVHSASWNAIGNTGGIVSLFVGYRGTQPLFENWQLYATQAAEEMGVGLGTAGDVNGDGFSDILVGARGWSNGELLEGAARVFHGAGDKPRNQPGWSAIGYQYDNGFAWSVARAGDINGDGYGDMVLGVPIYDGPGAADGGRVEVYHGGPDGLTVPQWFTNGWVGNQQLGISVSWAGDVNGDGYDDIIAGAHAYNGATGAAFAWYGGPGGLPGAYSWMVDGTEPGSYFGSSVAGAGDVNGDGYGDVIVGSPYGGTDQEGKAFVYLGSAAGLSTSPAWWIESDQFQAHLGNCVASAGDVNGDGYSDVVVATPDWDAPSPPFSIVDTGMIQIFHGGPLGLSMVPAQTITGGSQNRLGSSVASAGDVNGDGYADIVVGASSYNPGVGEGAAWVYLGGPGGLSGTAHWGQSSGQNFSGYGASVAGGGDVNGDGLSDVVIGAVFFDAGQQDEGIARVYAGPLTGSSGTTYITQLEGNGNFVNVGHVVAMIGDVNGDGVSDVASGAPGAGTNFTRDGKVVVAYGNGRFANGYSLPRWARQLNGVGGPLALLDSTGPSLDLTVEAFARSAAGRDRLRLQWEVKPLGQLLNGSGIQTGAWQLAAAPGVNGPGCAVALQGQVGGLSGSTVYHWRVRTRGKSPYFPSSPWYSPQGNGPQEADLRTGLDPTGAGDAPHAIAALRMFATPNPFNPRTVIHLSLPAAGRLQVTIYDVRGRQVAVLHDSEHEAGSAQFLWDGQDVGGAALASGAYIARATVGGHSATAKLVLIR